MTNLMVRLLMANKYKMFGISSVVCISSMYLVFNIPIEKVCLNCICITLGMVSAPFMGWNLARITEGD